MLEPFAQHSRALSVLQAQLRATEPQKKRLWQSIVVAKVKNQAECLRLCSKNEAAESPFKMAERVKSGDAGNIEATAAQRYFPALFYPRFTRGSDSVINAALNYGYAVIRGSAARHLAAYGFIPALGLDHQSELNSFNLADDIMEPFRPVIDQLVRRQVADCDEDELTPRIKQMLFNSLNLDIISGGSHHSVAYAVERLVQSLSRSLFEAKPALCLPELVETSQHRYE